MANWTVFISNSRFVTLDEAEEIAVLLYHARNAATNGQAAHYAFEVAEIYLAAKRRWQMSVAHIDTAKGPVKVAR